MANKYQIDLVKDNQIHQGDIIKNMPFYEKYNESPGKFELSMLEIPFSIVLTQECDLDNYTKEKGALKENLDKTKILHDKYLVSLLCAPLYNAEHLFSGNHLSELNIQSEKKNSEQRKYIKQNREPRYHYIEFSDDAKLVPMIIDFKHYYSVSISILESDFSRRICSLKPLYRELFSQRFTNFLSRIGLP